MKTGSTARWAPWLRHRQPRKPKSESRDPRSERGPKSEVRIGRAAGQASGFGLRVSFGSRISDFGFTHALLKVFSYRGVGLVSLCSFPRFCAHHRWQHSLVLLLVTASLALSQIEPPLPPLEQAQAGQALAEKWRNSVPGENAEYKGALKIRSNEGATQTVPIDFKIILGETNWQAIYEARATAKSLAQKLVIIHTPGKPNDYLFAVAAKPGDPPGSLAPLTGEQATVAFAGSDFWLTDLGLEFFQWPTQRLIKTEMRAGQVAKVLESTNPHPQGYARVVTWLEKESGAPILAEAYDSDGKLLKQFSIKHVKKVKGRYQLQEMQIRNLKTDSRTRIEYDLDKE